MNVADRINFALRAISSSQSDNPDDPNDDTLAGDLDFKHNGLPGGILSTHYHKCDVCEGRFKSTDVVRSDLSAYNEAFLSAPNRTVCRRCSANFGMVSLHRMHTPYLLCTQTQM